MDEESRAFLGRIAVALEKLADRPVVLPNGYVWDERVKNWTHPDEYSLRRSS